MKLKVKIEDLHCHTANELPTAWLAPGHKKVLDALGFTDTEGLDEKGLEEMTLMAIAELDPTEAAIAMLNYSLSDELTEGQIEQIANDMQNDKIFEEYPVIGLHHRLFAVNQLLRKAYNGKFPAGEFVTIEFKLTVLEGTLASTESLSSELLLKALSSAMPDNSIVKRLFPDEMSGEKAFPDADAIIWNSEVTQSDAAFKVKLTSSDYWLGDLLDANEPYEVHIVQTQAVAEDEE